MSMKEQFPVRPAGQIPVQQKIAELEGRIAALETKPCRCRVVKETTEVSGSVLVTENPHWKALWREFDALMKSIFKGDA